jgi:hypothetical protein
VIVVNSGILLSAHAWTPQSMAQSLEHALFTSEIVGSILAKSTLYRNSWVFSGYLNSHIVCIGLLTCLEQVVITLLQG